MDPLERAARALHVARAASASTPPAAELLREGLSLAAPSDHAAERRMPAAVLGHAIVDPTAPPAPTAPPCAASPPQRRAPSRALPTARGCEYLPLSQVRASTAAAARQLDAAPPAEARIRLWHDADAKASVREGLRRAAEEKVMLRASAALRHAAAEVRAKERSTGRPRGEAARTIDADPTEVLLERAAARPVYNAKRRALVLPPRKSRPASAPPRASSPACQPPAPAPPILASAERRLPARGSTPCSSCKYDIRSRAATSYDARIPPSACGAAVLSSPTLVRRGSALAVVLPAGLPRAAHPSRAPPRRPSAAAARPFDIRDDLARRELAARSNAAAPAGVGTIKETKDPTAPPGRCGDRSIDAPIMLDMDPTYRSARSLARASI
ncbi:hypothetical protein AB1Y20_000638 [Prymnesium parvum]|uniref:Uncharacterized protein n=1 Tax=Prymnesium parvum TaxID=97485 RepID=A0AB34K763_PRYPA